MHQNGDIAEVSDLILGAAPVDLSAAALNGAYANLKGKTGLCAILIAGAGTAGDDPVVTLSQAKDAAGTDAKVLHIHEVNYKIGSPGFTSANDLWQNVASIDRDNPVTEYDTDPIAGAENALILSIPIRESDLDVTNGFSHVRLQVADVGGNAQLGLILYVPIGRAYKGEHNSSSLE